MILEGIEVRMHSHYCFESRHRSCWGQVWWRPGGGASPGYVPCECSCHRQRDTRKT